MDQSSSTPSNKYKPKYIKPAPITAVNKEIAKRARGGNLKKIGVPNPPNKYPWAKLKQREDKDFQSNS